MKKPKNPLLKQFARELLDSYPNPEDYRKAFHEKFSELTKSIVESMLEEEMNDHLGYRSYERTDEQKDNYRNGHSSKEISTNSGSVKIDVPRDRNAEFEPRILPKKSKDLGMFEDKVIAMYSNGMSTREIEETILDLYGVEIDSTTISNMTNRILEKANEIHSRPVSRNFVALFIDGIRHKVRQENKVKEVTVYVAIGLKMDGCKEAIDFWIGESETSKFWLNVLNNLKSRGLNDILVVCCDNLPGISEAIKVVYPKADIQKCIIHQIRNSLLHVSYKDAKEFAEDMKISIKHQILIKQK